MKPVMLKIDSLKVAYGGIQAVKGVDLEIREGELVTLIGANGAGKTTTMKAITGLQGWAGGDVQYLGKSIKGVPSYNLLKQGLAMVPEGRGVFARMTIVENLQMGAFTRDDEAQIKADIDRMFGIFPRLKERANQLAGTMSGGEQQMLAMARALMSQPKLLLLDEPLSALDARIRRHLREQIRAIQQELGLTFVHVTHSQEEAMALADQMVVMNQGRIEQAGSPREVYNQPASAFVATFIGGHNLLEDADGPVAVRIDRMALHADESTAGDRPRVRGRICDIEYQGTHVLVGMEGVTLAPSQRLTVSLPESDSAIPHLTLHQPIWASWDAAQAHRLPAA